jgi:pyruvate dehydrogenase E1 component alpha subunit
VGTAHALAEGDWLTPTYRSNALQIARGVPMSDVLLFRRGRAEFASGHEFAHLPQAVPIATQVPHAVGLGMALNYERAAVSDPETGADTARPRSALDTLDSPAAMEPAAPVDEDRTAVACYLGDGATSEGDFHEGLNFAGVFETPVLFLCENNGWAISVPRERQTASKTIAGKASAYGFDGGQVDGNDPIAVLEFVRAALERVRSGRPVLVESLTYRQGAHTTSDDPERYRSRAADLPEWRTRDPLERYGEYLREQGALDDETETAIRDAAEEEVAEAVATAEAAPPPDPADVFDHVYETLPPRLREQRDAVLDRADEE